MIPGISHLVEGCTNNYNWNAYKEINPVFHIFAYSEDKS